MTDHSDLELTLVAYGRELRSVLSVDDLSQPIVAVLRDTHTPRRRWARSRPVRFAALVAASVLLFASAAYAGYRIVFAAGPVTVHDEPAPDVATGRRLALGEPIVHGDRRVRIAVVTPHLRWLEGTPQLWYDHLATDQVSLTLPPQQGLPEIGTSGVGLLIQEFDGDGRETIRKYLKTSTRVESVRIGSADGVFLSGGDHTLFYRDASGRYVTSQGRLAGNALIFQRDGLTIRIEARLPRGRMIEIASSLA